MSDLQKKLCFYRQFNQIYNFMKIRPVEAELFHADRRTDRHDEANSRFSQFCQRAQNWLCFTEVIYLNNIHNFLTKEKYDSNLDTRGSKKEKLGQV